MPASAAIWSIVVSSKPCRLNRRSAISDLVIPPAFARTLGA